MIARETNGYPPPPARSQDRRARESGSSSHVHAHSSAASSASSADAEHDPQHKEARANASDERPISETFQSAFAHVLEIADHIQTLFQVRADRARLAVRRSVMIGVALVLAAVALAPIIVGGSVLFTIGVAQSLTLLFGDRVWLGNLLGGTLILGSVAFFAWAVYARIAKRELRNKAAKYDHMQRVREARFGPSGPTEPQPSPLAGDGTRRSHAHGKQEATADGAQRSASAGE